MKEQPNEKAVVRPKSRQLGGNYERATSSEVKKLKRSLLGLGLTKRPWEVGLKPVFVLKQPAEVLLSRAPALD